MYLRWIAMLIDILLFIQKVGAYNFFSAITDMEPLVNTESKLIDELKQFVRKEEKYLEKLRNQLAEYELMHRNAISNFSTFFNPVNGFLIKKRLTVDWWNVEKLLKKSDERNAKLKYLPKSLNGLQFPVDSDLQGAAIALGRLQETYLLNTTSLANGDIDGVKFKSTLSASDCFHIGKILYWEHQYYYSALWFQEAKLRMDNSYSKEFKIELLRYLSDSLLEQTKIKLALETTIELLALTPDDGKTLGDKIYFSAVLDRMEKNFKHPSIEENLLQENIVVDPSELIPTNDYDIRHQRYYEQLCRNDVGLSPAKQKRLRCKYVTNRSAFLKIAPLKLEEALLDPYVAIYHDIMYDSEIADIMRTAKPNLKRAATADVDTGKTIYSTKIRTSKLAFLGERRGRDSPGSVMKRLSLRVEDMTGLSTISAERLQVVNYGIGGQYEPHHDFYYQNHPMSRGNRIATVLFYMTTVERGGATVFPYLDLSVSPVKGTAVIWYNLFDSGDGDMRTRHASCPVLIGSKWICNKWLHEENQEFLRPCTKKPTNPQHVLNLVEMPLD